MQYSIWVTTGCNMKCKYCYEKEKKDTMFSKENVHQLVEFIKKTSGMKKIQVSFFGGEPLLNFSVIKEIVLELEKEHFEKVVYDMTTNGLLLDSEKVQFIKDKGIRISLSCDGTKKVNDHNRVDYLGNGTHDRVMEKYRMLVERGIYNIRIRATVNSETYGMLKKSIEFFKSIDDDISVFFAIDYFDSNWTQEKIDELGEMIANIYREGNNNIDIIGDKMITKSRCSGGISSFHIYTNGDIYPCSFVINNEDFCIGDIYNGIDTKKIEKNIEIYNSKAYECKDCDYEEYCLTHKCKYLNYKLTGDLRHASPIVCQTENIKVSNIIL